MLWVHLDTQSGSASGPQECRFRRSGSLRIYSELAEPRHAS
jgi:hypothetical protein